MIAELLNQPPLWALSCGFFLASMLYASVGHGGASAYLAVMGLLGMAPAEMKPIALALNIAVSLVALVAFARAGHFQGRLFWPLAAVSVPAAFAGGWLQSPEPVFKIILAAALLAGAWRLACNRGPVDKPLREPRLTALLFLGASIGFLSGLIGIGGGIFLTPLLIFFHWSTARTAAAVSAAFIFANSCSGIAGFMLKGHTIPAEVRILLPMVLVGAALGASWGSRSAHIPALQRALAAVLVIAAAKFVII